MLIVLTEENKKKGESTGGVNEKGEEKCGKGVRRVRSFRGRHEHERSSGDEDVPSPAAAVLARRASRKVKPLREESGSDARGCGRTRGSATTRPPARRRTARKRSAFQMLSVAVCGFTVSCSHQLAWGSTMTAARVWERRAGRAGRWWCALCTVGPSGAAVSEAVPGREEYGARARTARPSGRRSCSSSPRITSTTLASRYEQDVLLSDSARGPRAKKKVFKRNYIGHGIHTGYVMQYEECCQTV